MRKARLTLILIITFAITGGVVAAKSKLGDVLYYTYDTSDPATLSVSNFTLVHGAITVLFNGTYFTDEYHATATAETIYIGN